MMELMYDYGSYHERYTYHDREDKTHQKPKNDSEEKYKIAEGSRKLTWIWVVSAQDSKVAEVHQVPHNENRFVLDLPFSSSDNHAKQPSLAVAT